MSDATPTYRFAPRHEAGLFGLARSQVITLSIGAVLALLAVLGARRPLVGLVVIVLSGAAAFAPLGGRPLVTWFAPIAAGLSGKRRGEAPPVRHELYRGRGLSATTASGGRGGGPLIHWQLPGLRRLVLGSVATDLGEVGVAEIGRGRRSSAITFALAGPRFGLVDAAGQARALAAWGQLLGSLARDAHDLHRLQLSERITPDDLSAPWRFVATAGRADRDALAVYREGLEVLSGQAVQHEVLLTLTLGHLSGRGSGRSREQQIAGECRRIGQLLEGAGFRAHPLGRVALAGVITAALDPERASLLSEAVLAEALTLSPASLAPRAWRSSWASIVTDSGYHACFEANGLPRLPVGPEWAWPLVLAEAPILRRTLALHVELARPDLAIRRAERAVVSQESDEAIRARWGFRSGARELQAHEAALDRELELASGYADARFALVASVSATSAEELSRACRALVSQAAASHVELRRCYNRQAEALVATLPLGVVRFRGGWR